LDAELIIFATVPKVGKEIVVWYLTRSDLSNVPDRVRGPVERTLRHHDAGGEDNVVV
jgi:hypothetical protein